jgi:predicted permease
MLGVILQMAAVIACGALWRHLAPAGLDVQTTRHVLSTLVFYLLLPALVLEVLWQAPLGADSLRIALIAAACVLLGLGLSALVCRACKLATPVSGAMLLAAAFPNATYLGLPVLEQTLGPAGRSVAIQYDLFACTPLLLSVGMMVAAHHGARTAREHPALALVKVPAVWAAVAALVLQQVLTPIPVFVAGVLHFLSVAVVPLMLLVLGMSLRWDTLSARHLGPVLPVAIIRLGVVPLVALWLADALDLSGATRTGVVLEAAMPSMVLGVVISDRYGLDTARYAAAVTVTTVLSLVTLSL